MYVKLARSMIELTTHVDSIARPHFFINGRKQRIFVLNVVINKFKILNNGWWSGSGYLTL